ncbi:Fe-S cluster assembly protein SufD [Pedobacter caeni]|uniref:Iron-regulated ABC transporter permease protein SufD n=1 Tax=Pedobacter caeni TaxID=288992 RepID=A0A1M5AS33_9SPHI|nr:Fe-S cluster assembly protein SufD [Pedobacter caeni]SHF32907.1 Iron-regulated ABC transporter permease protein SufD [Pedobacter caeni]
MTNVNYFKDQFEQLQDSAPESTITELRTDGFNTFNKSGLPTLKLEEWKYTNISSLFDKDYQFANAPQQLNADDLDEIRLAGHEAANELVFVNGRFIPALSTIRSAASQLVILPLEEAAKGSHQALVKKHLGQSSVYLKDGIHALNTSFIQDGMFILVPKGQQLEQPVYIYHISDARQQNTLSQPRSLIIVEENAKLQLTETYTTLGTAESFTNEVLEMVVKENAFVEYYKIQHDGLNASQVGSTHIHQVGKSYVHTVVVSLNGGVIRNNLNLVLDAEGNETHLYGLYLLKGNSHVDNHTLVDNKRPNCFSNQLYKGIADDSSTGVFSGRIIVQPDAQKTNAYQSNKNIILSDKATINTKPQLEIFADDVKCSHGCTVGQLDEEALFYLRARGIPKAAAEVLLLEAYAADILAQIKPEALRNHVAELIYEHLSIS